MRQAFQGVFIIGSSLVLLACLCGGWGTSQAVNAITPPEPTPQPTPDNDSAAVVREMGTLLERINVGEAVGSGARANDANTTAVHTSDLGQFVQDIAPVAPWFVLCSFGGALVFVVVAVLWFLARAKDGQDLARLLAGLTRLEALFKVAGVEAPREKSIDNPDSNVL